VDKLIALLQPPGPLAHTISLQPGQQQQLRAQAADAAGQQGMQGLYSVQTEGTARPSSQQPADQQLLHELQQQQQQEVHQSKTAPLPRLALVTPAAAAAAMLGANVPLSLPPRVPSAHNVPGILPPAQLLVPAAGGVSSGFDGRQGSSVSAPNSPSMGPRSGYGGAGSIFTGGDPATGALRMLGGTRVPREHQCISPGLVVCTVIHMRSVCQISSGGSLTGLRCMSWCCVQGLPGQGLAQAVLGSPGAPEALPLHQQQQACSAPGRQQARVQVA
jgi:hypothetical protein